MDQRFISENGYKLGQWTSVQRATWKKEKLSTEKIQKLENFSDWSWNLIDSKWEEGFKELVKYVQEFEHCDVSQKFLTKNNFKLGQWVSVQRRTWKKEKLSTEKIQKLESVKGWSWNINELLFNDGLDNLKNYVSNFGTADVPHSYSYNNSDSKFNLYRWIRNVKERKSKLTNDQITKLESLPNWNWNI